MSESLEMVKQIEENETVIIQIYDMCTDKKEYKKILDFCKKQQKEFKALQKEARELKIHQVKKLIIREDLIVRSTICNFQPDYYSHTENPLEITVTIADDSKNGLTTRGSAIFGGCNEAEYNEFIGILSSGYGDFTKEF